MILAGKVIVSLLGAGAIQAAAADETEPTAAVAEDLETSRRRIFGPGALSFAGLSPGAVPSPTRDRTATPTPTPAADPPTGPPRPVGGDADSDDPGGLDPVAMRTKPPMAERIRTRREQIRAISNLIPKAPTRPPAVQIRGLAPERTEFGVPIPGRTTRGVETDTIVSDDPPRVIYDPPVVDDTNLNDAVAWLLEVWTITPAQFYNWYMNDRIPRETWYSFRARVVASFQERFGMGDDSWLWAELWELGRTDWNEENGPGGDYDPP